MSGYYSCSAQGVGIDLEGGTEVEDYETSECSCIKESHVIEITQSACKITETKGSQMTWEIDDVLKFFCEQAHSLCTVFFPRNSDCYKMKNQLFYA